MERRYILQQRQRDYPIYGDNLVYFRWTVPTELNGASITLQGEVLENGKVLHTGSRTHGTEKPAVSQTPDTVFEKTAPPGFRLESPPVRTSMLNTQWSQWLYDSARGFYKETYGFSIRFSRWDYDARFGLAVPRS